MFTAGFEKVSYGAGIIHYYQEQAKKIAKLYREKPTNANHTFKTVSGVKAHNISMNGVSVPAHFLKRANSI